MIDLQLEAASAVPGTSAFSKSGLTRFLNHTRAIVGLTGEVELLLTSDAELKRLNRTFRNKNKSTDILSFPAPPEIFQHHAGDLAISLETAAKQAARYGHTLRDELRILILHGLLHLSGLDHETDRGEMAAREAELRAALKLPATLISRVTNKGRHSERSEESPHLLRNAQSLNRKECTPKRPVKVRANA